MNASHIETIYVALDAILDTRIGTLARMGDDVALQVLENGYHQRQDDRFPGVDLPTYQAMYAARNVETLAASTSTAMLPLLRHLVQQLTTQAAVRPYHDGCRVLVNTYPYKLSDVVNEAMQQTIQVWLQGLAQVELMYLPLRKLTPAHCKQHFAMMVMYDYGEWLHLHGDAFRHTRLAEVTLFGPALYFIKTPSAAELENLERTGTHPMRELEMMSGTFIGLELIDVKYFSIIKGDMPAA